MNSYTLSQLWEKRARLALRLKVVSGTEPDDTYLLGEPAIVQQYLNLSDEIERVRQNTINPLPRYVPIPRYAPENPPTNPQNEHEVSIVRVNAYRVIGRHVRRFSVRKVA